MGHDIERSKDFGREDAPILITQLIWNHVIYWFSTYFPHLLLGRSESGVDRRLCDVEGGALAGKLTTLALSDWNLEQVYKSAMQDTQGNRIA